MSGRRVPPERQSQAIVAAQYNRSVAWAPAHQCLHYATVNGFCVAHQPPVVQVSEQITAPPGSEDALERD